MFRFIISIVVFILLMSNVAVSADLNGSREAIDSAYKEALRHDFSFLSREGQLAYFKNKGLLVKLVENKNYSLHKVLYPYVRPEVRQFIQRLSEQFYNKCGEQLMITSALRLTTRQPRNASKKSVHPTGMAIDLRIPKSRSCRIWLPRTLISLEKRNVIEATKERWPAHYHVVVYPIQYKRYVLVLIGGGGNRHRVSNGETLSQIAIVYNTTVGRLVVLNGLHSKHVIIAGEFLRLR